MVRWGGGVVVRCWGAYTCIYILIYLNQLYIKVFSCIVFFNVVASDGLVMRKTEQIDDEKDWANFLAMFDEIVLYERSGYKVP